MSSPEPYYLRTATLSPETILATTAMNIREGGEAKVWTAPMAIIQESEYLRLKSENLRLQSENLHLRAKNLLHEPETRRLEEENCRMSKVSYENIRLRSQAAIWARNYPKFTSYSPRSSPITPNNCPNPHKSATGPKLTLGLPRIIIPSSPFTNSNSDGDNSDGDDKDIASDSAASLSLGGVVTSNAAALPYTISELEQKNEELAKRVEETRAYKERPEATLPRTTQLAHFSREVTGASVASVAITLQQTIFELLCENEEREKVHNQELADAKEERSWSLDLWYDQYEQLTELQEEMEEKNAELIEMRGDMGGNPCASRFF